MLRRQRPAGPIELASNGTETINKRIMIFSETTTREEPPGEGDQQTDQGRQPGNEKGDDSARQNQGGNVQTKPLETTRTLEVLERSETDLGQETMRALRKDERLGQGHELDSGRRGRHGRVQGADKRRHRPRHSTREERACGRATGSC